jgi:tRNA(Arg) A34 adenosine deaminase TadA
MVYAMQTKILSAGSPCPSGAFGAVIVNRTTNQLLCQTNQTTFTDNTDHAEMHVLRECAAYFDIALFPGAGTNKAVWADCSLYTTGESCPMCQSGQLWTGVGETIYSSTIPFLAINRHQILIRSKKVVKRGIPGGITPPLTLISFVDTSITDPYFAWQNTTAPCPGGCVRNMANVCVPPSLI